MSDEKGGSIAFIVALALVGLWWSSQPAAPKAEPMPVDDGLIEQVATIRDFRAVEPDHIVDANKMVEPQKEVIVFSAMSCPKCQEWISKDMQKFMDAGWKVAFCEQNNCNIVFSFTVEGRSVERVGYVSFEQLGEVLR